LIIQNRLFLYLSKLKGETQVSANAHTEEVSKFNEFTSFVHVFHEDYGILCLQMFMGVLRAATELQSLFFCLVLVEVI
jgi:succinate-acetate transporter protein